MRLSAVLCGKAKQLSALLLTMPKEKSNLPTLKAVRKLKKVDMAKYPPGIINLQVLGNSLYLFTDQTRYLFNCGEGTQRLAHEHKQKLAKLDHVFLTTGRWERVGGLPGMSLTVQDIGVEKLWIHGPPGVNRLFSTTRRFLILKDLDVTTVNTCHSEKYEDHVLTVKYINVSDGKDQDLAIHEETDTTDYYSAHRQMEGKQMIKVDSDDSVLKKNIAVQYAIHLKPKEATLLIDRCIAKGVPPGPLLGKLKSGQDVTLPNGTVVKSDDVRGGGCPGPIILVVDCPTLDHLDMFVNHPAFEEYHSKTGEAFTHAVVHFTPLSILQDKKYISFMEKFQLSTKHLIINEDCASDANEAVHRMQTKLNVISETLFPMMEPRRRKELSLPVAALVGETGMKIGLRGRTDIESPPWSITPDTYREELSSNSDFLHELSSYKSSIGELPPPSESDLLFLGTGSSIPNKTRNVSAIYLSINSENAILFDCGEGTFSQLMRHSNGPNFLEKLKLIYISHLHADHHLGLFSFLKKKPGLTVIAPRQISSWLANYSADFENLDYTLIPCDSVSSHDFIPFGISSLTTCLVRHCPNAFGISLLTLGEQKRITYSGDTMPSENLIQLGKDSDILIHEATMEDTLEKEALLKMHSTLSQAIRVGELMSAKFTILTHFSQRYSKIPFLSSSLELSRVGVAFDNLFLNLNHTAALSGKIMMGVLSEGWKEDLDEMEQRREKRSRRADKEKELEDKPQMQQKCSG